MRVAKAQTEHWRGKADTVGLMVTDSLKLVDAETLRVAIEDVGLSDARADTETLAEATSDGLRPEGDWDSEIDSLADADCESDPLVLSDTVRDSCDAVPEAVVLTLSVHVTVWVTKLEGDTDGDGVAVGDPAVLCDEDAVANVLAVAVIVRVSRWLRECECVAAIVLEAELEAHALLDDRSLPEVDATAVVDAVVLPLVLKDTEFVAVDDRESVSVDMGERLVVAERDGDSDNGTVEVPHIDVDGEIVRDGETVLETTLVADVDKHRLIVPEGDIVSERIGVSDTSADEVGIRDKVASPVATVGVKVAEKPVADGEYDAALCMDCVTCDETVLMGDTEGVEVVDDDKVARADLVSV